MNDGYSPVLPIMRGTSRCGAGCAAVSAAVRDADTGIAFRQGNDLLANDDLLDVAQHGVVMIE